MGFEKRWHRDRVGFGLRSCNRGMDRAGYPTSKSSVCRAAVHDAAAVLLRGPGRLAVSSQHGALSKQLAALDAQHLVPATV